MEQRPRRARRLTDAEYIFNLHGFFYKTWRSIVGVFRSSEELDAHERDQTCPREVLYSVDDQSTGDYENADALRQQLLFDGEEKARVVVMSIERYIRNVRRIDTRPIRRIHQSTEMYWDLDAPCVHCGCIYLMGNTARTRCCSNGTLAMYQYQCRERLKPLEPLEGTFLRLARLHDNSSEAHIECLSKLWEYNNCISLGVVCVDHGDNDDAARAAGVVAKYNWDNPKFGDFCVKIQGRTFLMLKKEGHENGVDWATLGNVSEALEGGLKRKKELHRGILRGLLLDTFKLNPLVDEVCTASRYLRRLELGANLSTHCINVNNI